MRILFFFWGGGEGGDAAALIALASALKENPDVRFEMVAYAATHPDVFHAKCKTAGLECHLIAHPEKAWEESGLKREDFDLVHVHHGRSIPKRSDVVPLRKVAGKLPLAITVHGPLPLHSITYGGLKSHLSRKLAARWFDAVIVPSEAKLKEWREFTRFSRNVVAIPNIVPLLTRRDKAVSRGSLGLPQDADMALFCSRLDEEKDPFTFVKAIKMAARERPKLLGLMAGSGDLARQTADLACQVEAPVKLLGYRDDLESIYSAADVFVQTSLYESFCITLLQAAEMGLPCAASSLPVFKDFYGEMQSFRWFAPGDAEGCAKAICDQLTCDRAVPHSVSKLRDFFSESSIVERHSKLWKALLRGAQ